MYMSIDRFLQHLDSLSSDPVLLQVSCEESDLSDAEKVFAECNQQRPLPWEECIQPERMKQCVKIGEGTFGEVFSTVNASGETVALKVRRVCVSALQTGSFNNCFFYKVNIRTNN